MLDEHNPLPLYYQLKNLLEEQIDSGFFKPGEKIPSENELCELYKVSRTTVRQAIANLVNSSKLIRTQGLGTFVSDVRIASKNYRLNGFSQDMKTQGHKPVTKILDLSPILASIEIAQNLHIKENEAVIFIKRLRYVDGKVLGLDISYLPFSRFSGILKEDLESKSLYDLLRREYDTIPSRSTYQIKSIKCPREVAGLVELAPSDPILLLTEVVYDQHDVAFECGTEFYRGDRYSFNIEIRKVVDEALIGIHNKTV
jgi:GntR family transcriptional regulator